MDFSKIEAGRLELERLPVDLNELAENVTSLFSERARSKGLDLAALVDPAAPRRIAADPVRLGQVLGNLVNNALKFTDKGSVKLIIGKSPHDPRHLEISVTDTGVGIPEAKLATIFDAFSQADQSTTRQFGGTGLGLTIAKRLVEASGGSIHVSSVVGSGSTFTVVLPMAEPKSRPWPALELSASGLAFCLLDVSKEATASALERYLGASGYNVIRQPRPTAAQCRQVSLVCTDAHALPELEIAADGSCPLIVAIRDIGDSAAENAATSRRADAVLAWPLLRAEVEELLRRIVNGDTPLQPADDADWRSASPAKFRPFRVLVADDGAVNREVATEALRVIGATVETVENGAQAVQAVNASDYDLVLMDGSMPELDGFEATRRIRRTEQETGRPRIPIVALTAHVVGAGADQWRDAGMDGIVHKPLSVDKLAQIIARLLPQLVIADAHKSGFAAALEAPPPSDAPEQPATDNEGPLLDAGVLDQLHDLASAGGGDLAKRVVELYVQHAPAALEDIRRAMLEGAPEPGRKAAHALKSMSFSIGASRVADRAAAIERDGGVGGRVPSQSTFDELAQALRATLIAVTERAEPKAFRTPPASTAAPDVQAPGGQLERSLAKALERDELSVLYQPIVERTGARTAGVEALVRWTPPGAQTIAPAVFIPTAERTGLIRDIGAWVLQRACEDFAAWPDLTVAVNVSPIQFGEPDLVRRFEQIVSKARFDWRRLELEITEGALLTAEDAVLQAMLRLNAHGVTFALDDFGTGYSSLNYLRRFPFGKIKIDRSFVENVGSSVEATIVHAITSIGRSLGLKLVAEGVESMDQQQFLAAAGVHYMQGYLFGRPMSKEAIMDRLHAEGVAQIPAESSGPRGMRAAP